MIFSERSKGPKERKRRYCGFTICSVVKIKTEALRKGLHYRKSVSCKQAVAPEYVHSETLGLGAH